MIEQFLLSITILLVLHSKIPDSIRTHFLAIFSLDGAVRFRTRATFNKNTPGTEVSLKITWNTVTWVYDLWDKPVVLEFLSQVLLLLDFWMGYLPNAKT